MLQFSTLGIICQTARAVEARFCLLSKFVLFLQAVTLALPRGFPSLGPLPLKKRGNVAFAHHDVQLAGQLQGLLWGKEM